MDNAQIIGKKKLKFIHGHILNDAMIMVENRNPVKLYLEIWFTSVNISLNMFKLNDIFLLISSFSIASTNKMYIFFANSKVQNISYLKTYLFLCVHVM